MNYIKELLFPRRCPVCDEIVPGWNKKICKNCEEKLQPVQEPWCCRCGKPLRREEQEYCGDCRRKKHVFCRGRAIFTYDSAAISLYRFKYQGRQEYAEYYGEMAARQLAGEKEFQKAQALIPVPPHPARERCRGYNQAFLFADALGKAWGIPVCRDLVVRCQNTQPLKRLNPAERQNNLKKAFKLKRNDVKLKTIIIVDDIYTTGSTIDAVSDVLSKAGVQTIYFVTLAAGRGF